MLTYVRVVCDTANPPNAGVVLVVENLMAEAALSPAVAKPAHAPDALVYDFDMFNDPGIRTDPHNLLWDV
jgi:hypothetical protein